MNTVAMEAKSENKFDIVVIYNGVQKPLTVNENQAIQAVLQHAINLFGSLPNPHTLSLFTESGAELQDNTHVRDTPDVKTGARLLLRPSQVKGG